MEQDKPCLSRSNSRSTGNLQEQTQNTTRKSYRSHSLPDITTFSSGPVYHAPVHYSGPVTYICLSPTEKDQTLKFRTQDSWAQSDVSTPSSSPDHEASSSSATTYIINDQIFPRDTLPTVSPAHSNASVTESTSGLRRRHPIQRTHSEIVLRQSRGLQHQKEPAVLEPEVLETAITEEKEDLLHDLACRLFNTLPYRIFSHYRGWNKVLFRYFFTFFFLYQGLAMFLVTICEDGGFKAVFQSQESMHFEVLHRLVLFSVRVGGRIFTPLFCFFQLPTIATTPSVPTTRIQRDEAIKKLVSLHNHFSSAEEVAEIKNDPSKAFEKTEEMVNRQMNFRSLLVTVLNAFLFTYLLFYLGGFSVAKDKIMKGGICNMEILDSIVVPIPFFSTHIHLLVLFECISFSVICLLIAIVKDFYCYENRIAIYTVMIGGETRKLYDEIRKRWRSLDFHIYLAPLGLFMFLQLSIISGKAFTPKPSHEFDASHLVTWYFWMSVLSVLKFFSVAPRRMAKVTSLIGYLIVIIFICTTKFNVAVTIPSSGASATMLLYICHACFLFNLHSSLQQCHYHHHRETGNQTSHLLKWLSAAYRFALPVCIIIAVYREVTHFAQFLYKA